MSRKLTLGLLVLLAIAPAAHAQGPYVGAGVGSSSAQLPGGTTQVDFDDTGYVAYAGWRVLRYLSAELSYTDFGSPSATVGTTSFEADVTIAALWAVGILQVSPRLELYGRLGYSAWDSSVTAASGSAAPQTAEADGTDLAWGAGLGYNLTPSWGLQVDWHNYDVEGADRVTFTALTARFRF